MTLRRGSVDGPGQAGRLAFNAGPRAEVASTRPASSRPSTPATAVRATKDVAAGAPEVEKRDWAFVWTLVFTAVLFLRPQDIVPPLEALHLAEVSALAGLSCWKGFRASTEPLCWDIPVESSL